MSLLKTLQRSLAVRSALLLATVAMASSMPANAIDVQPSEVQFFLLPEYCKAKLADSPQNRQGRWNVRLPVNEQRIDYWRAQIGADWPHLGQYCGGLIYLSMAQSPTEIRRSRDTAAGLFQRAAGAIGTARDQVTPGSALWAEMGVKQARALEGAGNREAALNRLVELQQLVPENTDVYVALGQTLKRGGQLRDAIAILEEGLENVRNDGPLLFYLARYYYAAGDIQRAAELLPQAEEKGMKMDSLRERLPSDAASVGAETSDTSPPID